MSGTPEHDKLDRIRRVNPAAADLLHLLVEDSGWELVNGTGVEPIRLPVRRATAHLLGINLDRFDAERHAGAG